MTMRAARWHGKKDIRIEEIDSPTAGPGQVLVDVAWCGICDTDLHEYLEGPIFIPPAGHPHPISGDAAPVTLGHEMSGTVAALGEGVTDLEVGQKVVVEPYIVREEDRDRPDYNLAPDMNFIGLGGDGGGLAEQIAVRRRWVHPVADSVPLDQAALIEPLSVAHHAWVRAGSPTSGVALIGGAGPIGALTAVVAAGLAWVLGSSLIYTVGAFCWFWLSVRLNRLRTAPGAGNPKVTLGLAVFCTVCFIAIAGLMGAKPV